MRDGRRGEVEETEKGKMTNDSAVGWTKISEFYLHGSNFENAGKATSWLEQKVI